MPDPTDASVAAPAAAPVIEAAPLAPAPETTPAPAEAAAVADPAPAATETPSGETAAPDANLAAEGETAEEAEKPAETAESAETEAAAEAEAAPDKPTFPTYEPFKVPEGVTFGDEDSRNFGNIAGKYGLTQDAAQEFFDFGVGYLKRQQEAMAQHQHDAFAETRRTWRTDFEKQSGNRRNTLLADARHAIAQAFPADKDRAALMETLSFTGAGDHPAVIRAFAALGKRLREGSAPQAGMPVTQPTSPADRRYGARR